MNKLKSSIYEINCMNNLASEDKWVNNIHPLVKLIITITYISFVVSFHKYDITEIIGMVIYPIVIFITGYISFKDSLRRLRLVLPLVCFVGIFNPFFDRDILMKLNGVNISGGTISMITLMIKGILTVLASYLLIATTTIEKICYAMSLIHIPKIFVTQILFIYRYITLLLNEANRITEAYSLRAPNQKGIHYKVWGSLIGQLLLRSMDRAENIYESMSLRGYVGEFYYTYNIKCSLKDYLYFITWISIFLAMRFFPILEFIGNIFV
ncbi:cobalt ECF transporter T component CbiQ [Clostridium sp.]|uniref:cobalt ECF transporter T component CbiQ n=1 Tax=Clostridium sp. TaxID=1506 RepID=UPI00260854C3|nr:cobalt ECF transporter T component CbiQ [Clostridium sp.]